MERGIRVGLAVWSLVGAKLLHAVDGKLASGFLHVLLVAGKTRYAVHG